MGSFSKNEVDETNRQSVYSTYDEHQKNVEKQVLLDEKRLKSSYRQTGIRWVALACSCLLMVGLYFSYDYPAYMQDYLAEVIFDCPNVSDNSNPRCKSFNEYYPWLYSIYSFPNCVLPLLGGFFIDKVGVRSGLIIFCTFITIGQFICSLAGIISGGWGYKDHVSVFVWFYIGRFIFALGAENIKVTNSTVISKWFVGKELNLALGTNLSVARAGTVIAGFIYPELIKGDTNLTWPLMFATGICIISEIFMVGLVLIDRKADKQEGKENDSLNPAKKVKLSDVKDFPLIYWVLNISCVLNYIGIFCFLQNANGFLKINYQNTEAEASQYMTIPYLIFVFMGPFIGFVVDKIGLRHWMIFSSSFLLFVSHALWLILPNCPEPEEVCSRWIQTVPLIILGIFQSVYATVIWSCIPLVLEQRIVGTGFGVITAVQNLGLATGPLISSYIINNTQRQNGYYYNQVFFTGLGIVCILIAVWLIILNAKKGNPLGKKKKVEREEDSDDNVSQQSLDTIQQS